MVHKSAADVKMEIQGLVWSLKSSILSSTSFQIDKTVWGVVSAAVEQSRRKANMVAPGDGKFVPWGWPQSSSKPKKQQQHSSLPIMSFDNLYSPRYQIKQPGYFSFIMHSYEKNKNELTIADNRSRIGHASRHTRTRRMCVFFYRCLIWKSFFLVSFFSSYLSLSIRPTEQLHNKYNSYIYIHIHIYIYIHQLYSSYRVHLAFHNCRILCLPLFREQLLARHLGSEVDRNINGWGLLRDWAYSC